MSLKRVAFVTLLGLIPVSLYAINGHSMVVLAGLSVLIIFGSLQAMLAGGSKT